MPLKQATHLTISFEFTLYPPATTITTTTFAYRNQALYHFLHITFSLPLRTSRSFADSTPVILVSSSHLSDIWLVK